MLQRLWLQALSDPSFSLLVMTDVLDLLPPLRRALHAAGAALSPELAGGLWQLAEDDLDLALGELRAHEARCAALRFALVQQARDRGMQQRTGAPDIARWLADRFGVDQSAARAETDLAQALRPDGVAGATGAALADGRIDEARARLVVAVLDRLPGPLTEQIMVEAEAALLVVAEHADTAAVRRIGRELKDKVTVVSADDPPPDDHRDRANAVSLTRLEPGWWRISGILDEEHAAIIDAAMAALTHPQHHPPSTRTASDQSTQPAGDEPRPDQARATDQTVAPCRPCAADSHSHPHNRDAASAANSVADGESDRAAQPLPPPAQRRASALKELCLLALRHGQLPAHGGVASTVLLTLSWADLHQQAGSATLLGTGGQLYVADARRIACDAGIIPVLLGSDGQPLDHGRMARACPPGLRRLLDLRDQGCVFPHCGRRTVDCDAHRIQHWADGGPTSERNLCLLCPHHHRQIHRQHWQLSLTGDQVRLTPPDTIDPRRRPRIHGRHLIRRIAAPVTSPPQPAFRPDRR